VTVFPIYSRHDSKFAQNSHPRLSFVLAALSVLVCHHISPNTHGNRLEKPECCDFTQSTCNIGKRSTQLTSLTSLATSCKLEMEPASRETVRKRLDSDMCDEGQAHDGDVERIRCEDDNDATAGSER
jgi:hypothetical protein